MAIPESVAAVLATCREQLAPLLQAVAVEQRRKEQRWCDEAPMLDAQVEALEGTRALILRERQQLTNELSNLKAFLDQQAADAAKAAPQDPALAASDVIELQAQLDELHSKLASLDASLEGFAQRLASAREDERAIHETQLVVLQDTRRLLHSEASSLAGELKRRQAAAQLAADRTSAAQLGLTDLGRLSERLTAVEAQLDRAKLDKHFPAQHGFRFSGGGGGVFCGCKDLHLCEVSGAFSLSLEPVAGSVAAGGQQREVRLQVTLSGVSGSSSSSDFKQQQQQQQQQQAAKAAARAQSLKRAQPQPPSPLRSSSVAAAGSSHGQQQPRPDAGGSRASSQQPAAQPGGSFSSRRGAAVARFLGTLSDRQQSLSNSLKERQAGGCSAEAARAPAQAPRPGAAGFSTRLAAAMGDKAAAFSELRDSQAGDATGMLPASLSLAASQAGACDGEEPAASQAAASASGIAAADSSRYSSSASGASSPLATPPAGAGGGERLPGSPARRSPRGVGAAGVGHSSSSHELEDKLKAKFGSMRGKLGGLLTDSKQKLADSKAKLADSRIVAESRLKLAEGKARLADSKLVQESRAAARHLLEDSKHLLEDGRAGIKRQLASLQRDDQAQPGPVAGQPWQGAPAEESAEQQPCSEQQLQQPDGDAEAAEALADEATPRAAALAPVSAEHAAPAAAQQAAVASAAENAPVAAEAVADVEEQPPPPPQQQLSPPPSPSGASPVRPAATATGAAAGGGGGHVRQLLDEAQEGGGGLGGFGAAAGGSSSGSAGVAGAKGSGTRRGVVVMLLAEGLEVVAEKGSKVPNIRASLLGLEVECSLSATLTYSSSMGWQSAGLKFEVLSLERVVQGSNLPLPVALIKSILNIALPSVFTKLLLTSLPHELGEFILLSAAANAAAAAAAAAGTRSAPGRRSVEHTAAGQSPCAGAAATVAAAGGAGVWLGGELSLSGVPAACLSANLVLTADDVPKGRAPLGGFVQELRAAQRARALLSLQEPRHAAALALVLGAWGLQLLGIGGAAAAGAAGAGAASLTLRDLLRLHLQFGESSCFQGICRVCQTALDAVCGLPHLASPTPLDFAAFMSSGVGALVRKPVRLAFGLRRLLLGVDAGAGLTALRTYCERAAREFAANAKGEDALLLLQRPLSLQLELLELWHAALSARLESFASQFKAAGGRFMLSADQAGFSVAAEALSYEGPLRLEVPLPLVADLAAGACTWDVQLANPRSAVSLSLASKLRFISAVLAKAAFGASEEECDAERHAAAMAAAAAAGLDAPLTQAEEIEALLSIWSAASNGAAAPAGAAAARDAAPAGDSSASGGLGLLLRRSTTDTSSSAISRTTSSCSMPAAAAAAAISRCNSTPPGPGAGRPASAGSEYSQAAGDSAEAAALLGRVCVSRAWAGLVLDESRLKELLAASGGAQEPALLGGLLACYGQLFTACFGPVWPQQPQQPADSVAAGESAGSGGPQAVLRLGHSSITRVRAELETGSFESSVPPRIVVQLLHVLALAVAHKFGASLGRLGGARQLEWLSKAFSHASEYLDRDSLDVLACVDAAATAIAPTTTGAAATAPGAAALQLLIAGAAPGAAAGGAAAGGSQAGGACCYVVNEVNLLTVLDTIKLLLAE